MGNHLVKVLSNGYGGRKCPIQLHTNGDNVTWEDFIQDMPDDCRQLERESGALDAECAKLSGELSVVRLRNQQLEELLRECRIAVTWPEEFKARLDAVLAERVPLLDDIQAARSACGCALCLYEH